MTTATNTTLMTHDQVAESAAVLARAFDDDPLITYVLPADTPGRAGKLHWFMGRGAAYGHAWGEVHTTTGTVEGNAVWLPPGDVKLTLPRMARNGLLLAPFRFGMGPFARFLTATNELERIHTGKAPEPHWYLMILGVDPPRQGQGIGGALIQPILARADAERLPCYLETNKTKNVPFYQKHGFDIVYEGDLPKGGPHVWTMKRPASTG